MRDGRGSSTEGRAEAREAYLATIRRLAKHYGSQAAAARALGVSSQRLSQMLKRR